VEEDGRLEMLGVSEAARRLLHRLEDRRRRGPRRGLRPQFTSEKIRTF
jgi:hypothetical protein